MRIILDHNTPHNLRHQLPGHEVHTAAYRGWSELENGELLRAAAAAGYDLIITCDQGIRQRDDLHQYDITVLTVMNGLWPVIRNHLPALRLAVSSAQRGRDNLVRIDPAGPPGGAGQA